MLADNNQSSEELKRKLQEVKIRYQDLCLQKTNLESQLKDISKRIGTLAGSNFSRGLISQLEIQLKQAIQRETDEKLPRAVWKKRSSIGFDKGYRISRVTPKRVYVKIPGGNEIIYQRSNGAQLWDTEAKFSVLDIDACVEAFKNHDL